MIKSLIFFLITFVYSSVVYGINLVVIDVNFLINNSKQFIEISENINQSQKIYTDKFTNIEKNLLKKKEELENLKLIINENEFNLKKEDYYKEVEEFENIVFKFNNHYENEILKIKNMIFTHIIELTQEYAVINKIDLILDKNQYLIASDNINITDKIFNQLNESNIDLNFKDFDD